MTFDEIFQQYVAQGFTKPTAGVAGIETLMPTTATVAPIVPVQQPQDTSDRRDNFTNVPDTTTNAGIISLSDGVQSIVDLYSQLPTPLNLAIRGIQNIQNPYTNIFGKLNEVGLAAQARNMAQARGLSKQAEAEAAAQGITGFTGYGTSQQRGAAMHGGGNDDNGGDHDGGASAGAQGDEAAGMGGY